MLYVNLFFIYSILGFVFESTLVKMVVKNYESGIMFGFWTPVYGLGVLVIILIYKILEKHINNKLLRGILLFFGSAIILSILEFIGGVLIENLFNKVFWNYSFYKYNLGKYISLETAIIWGVFSILIIYLVNPLVKKIAKIIPKWLTYILIILFIIDLVMTFVIKL